MRLLRSLSLHDDDVPNVLRIWLDSSDALPLHVLWSSSNVLAVSWERGNTALRDSVLASAQVVTAKADVLE